MLFSQKRSRLITVRIYLITLFTCSGRKTDMAISKAKRAWVSPWLFCLVVTLLVSACGSGGSAATTASSAIAVVAAENFYGNIAAQIGGSHITVTSIISDPNIDPHEFDANPRYARAVGTAKLVIANGGGYDDWMDKLLSSTPNSNRQVLKGFELASVKLPNNEHVWYSYKNAGTIAEAIADKLKTIDSRNTATYEQNLQTFKQSLLKIEAKLAEIKSKYHGTPIGLTETIFLYQTGPMDLDVKTPNEFQKALAEGNDPPASAVATAEDQVNKKQVRVLIYNLQTASKITDTLQSDARAQHIPIVPVTETMPPDKTYQSWMLDQLTQLEQALAK
jgi:zinc/manganese transport system substrate-binding protein